MQYQPFAVVAVSWFHELSESDEALTTHKAFWGQLDLNTMTSGSAQQVIFIAPADATKPEDRGTPITRVCLRGNFYVRFFIFPEIPVIPSGQQAWVKKMNSIFGMRTENRDFRTNGRRGTESRKIGRRR